jgi:F1F0 ATPase subunit 2
MEVQILIRFFAAALAGALLGTVYFGGLWLTIERIQRTSRPGILLFASFIVRLGVAMAGFYLVAGGELGRLAACLAAFLVTRWLFIKRLQPVPKNRHDIIGQAE